MKLAVTLLASALLAAATIDSAHTQTPAPASSPMIYIVTYIDVLPRQKAQGIKALKQFRSACANEPGNMRCEAVQRMEQQNEFALLEVWKDQKAYQTHAAGAGAQLREKLKPILASPYDERLHTGLSVLPPQPAPNGRIVYAVTHVDAVPGKETSAIPILTRMAETGREEQGNGRLEMLRQLAPLTNHFTLVEIWSNKRLLENHQAQTVTMQFRDTLQPLLGAPYDERLYKILD
jgi:quinol monooxygenase YgiN